MRVYDLLLGMWKVARTLRHGWGDLEWRTIEVLVNRYESGQITLFDLVVAVHEEYKKYEGDNPIPGIPGPEIAPDPEVDGHYIIQSLGGSNQLAVTGYVKDDGKVNWIRFEYFGKQGEGPEATLELDCTKAARWSWCPDPEGGIRPEVAVRLARIAKIVTGRIPTMPVFGEGEENARVLWHYFLCDVDLMFMSRRKLLMEEDGSEVEVEV